MILSRDLIILIFGGLINNESLHLGILHRNSMSIMLVANIVAWLSVGTTHRTVKHNTVAFALALNMSG